MKNLFFICCFLSVSFFTYCSEQQFKGGVYETFSDHMPLGGKDNQKIAEFFGYYLKLENSNWGNTHLITYERDDNDSDIFRQVGWFADGYIITFITGPEEGCQIVVHNEEVIGTSYQSQKGVNIYSWGKVYTQSYYQEIEWNVEQQEEEEEEVFDIPSNIDEYDQNGSTALIKAIEQGNLKYVKLLVEAGADVNLITTDINKIKLCPALFALRYPGILEYLINNGASVNVKLSLKQTILHFAVNNNYYESIVILLENGAEVNAVDLYGITPLHLLFKYGHERTFQKNALITLLDNGANVNSVDHDGWKPFHYTYQNCDIDLFRELVKRGANLNEFNPKGFNALHMACQYKKLNVIKFLVEDLKMDVNTHARWTNGTDGGPTPFYFAIPVDEDFEVAEYLLEKGADINAKQYIVANGKMHIYYNSVLSWAIATKFPYHVIEWLKEHGAKY